MNDTIWTDGSWEQAAARIIADYELRQLHGHPTPYREMFDRNLMWALARRAWGELIECGHDWHQHDQVNLLASKQHDYGHENINKFGEEGLRVRLWDKISRYENLCKRGVGPANESLADTLRDMIGYVVLWGMVRDGTFARPLSGDMK